MTNKGKNLGPSINALIKNIDTETEKSDEPKTVEDQINYIISAIETRTKLTEGTNLGILDPRESLQKAIKMAKRSGNAELLAKTYDRIIAYHEKGNYNFDAAIIAAEARRVDKALELIDKLIDPMRKPDYVGALKVAKKLGRRYVKQVKNRIDESIKKLLELIENDKLTTPMGNTDYKAALRATKKLGRRYAKQTRNRIDEIIKRKNNEAKKQFEGKEVLTNITYVTENGSKYQINEDNMLIRNGAPLTLDGVAYQFIGIADRELAGSRVWDFVGYGDRYDYLNWYQGYYLANDKYHFTKTLASFSEVKNHMGDKISLVGINREAQELFISSPLVKCEQSD